MVLNLDKRSVMLLGVKDEVQADLVRNNVTIINSKEEKDLGITFDTKLDFSTHLASITKNVNIKLNVVTILQKHESPEQKAFLTSSFIKSQFNHRPLIWIFCSKKALCRLNNIQKRSLRHIHQDSDSGYIDRLVDT